MDRALLHIDSVYDWPSLRALGVVCKTALTPNTGR
jgi:xanthine dehydrogenase molybdopterin-binding subunit B